MNYSWVAFLTAALAILVYGGLRKKLGSEDWWGWWDTLASVFISFVLAFGAALWLYTSQVDHESQKLREAHRTQITETVYYILCQLEVISATTAIVGDTSVQYWRMYMPSIAFEEAIRSGVFGERETLAFLTLEAQLKDYNLHARQVDLTALASVPDSRKVMEVRNLERKRTNILNNCRFLTNLLSLDLRTISVEDCSHPDALDKHSAITEN